MVWCICSTFWWMISVVSRRYRKVLKSQGLGLPSAIAALRLILHWSAAQFSGGLRSFNMKKSPDAMFYHVLSYFIMSYHVLHNTEDMVWVLRIWRAGCKRRFSSCATGHAENTSSLNWRRLTKLAKTWAAAAKLEWSQMKCNHHLDTWVGTSQDCT